MRHLRRPGTRAQYISATGKTLVAIGIALALQARLTLVVVPTLDLAAQTALAWRRDGYLRHTITVSSMDTAGHQALAAAQVGSTASPSHPTSRPPVMARQLTRNNLRGYSRARTAIDLARPAASQRAAASRDAPLSTASPLATCRASVPRGGHLRYPRWG
ncbi:hypothetical protein [Streptomyces agglomeratus]|uniref:hypothetical protein n=1 Tax=Streptomyces agglomeratus TaxID=285458 RepID=UPI00114C8715|nr:hypothetical protein [Streptomyces agglomeratus]